MSYINTRGNTVYTEFVGDSSRYPYDAKLVPMGFQQYDTDQDAWYFGCWVHVGKREVWTYAEGDLSVVRCPTVESFKAELAHMAAFYGDPPPAFIVLDTDTGIRTEHYGTRPGSEVTL